MVRKLAIVVALLVDAGEPVRVALRGRELRPSRRFDAARGKPRSHQMRDARLRRWSELLDRPILLTHGVEDVVDRPADSLEVNVAAATAAGVDIEFHTCAGAGHGRVVEVCADDWARWVRVFLAANGGI